MKCFIASIIELAIMMMIDINRLSNISTSNQNFLLFHFRKVGLVIFILGLLNGSILAADGLKEVEYKLNRIEIIGNVRTKSEIILRELNIQPDSVYTTDQIQAKIHQSQWNLKNLNLFNQIDMVHSIVLIEDEDQWVVQITLVEKWYFWPIPFVEFADRNFNQWYEFDFDTYRTNYGLYLFKYNAFGRNQTIKLSLINGYNREINLQYRVPWFLKNKKLGLNMQIRTRTNREVWYKTDQNQVQFFRDLDHQLLRRNEFNLEINIRPKLNIWHTPFFNYQFQQVSDTISKHLNPEFLISSESKMNVFGFGYRFLLERRNNKLFPTEGHMLESTVGFNYLPKGVSYPYLSAELGAYKHISPKFSSALNLAFRKTWSDAIPYVLVRALGYDQSVRGYESYVMDGQSLALMKYEIRYHILNHASFSMKYMPLKQYKSMPAEAILSFFVDQGYAQNTINALGNDLANQYLLGFGIGLSTVFYYDKVFRFEYSFNKMGEHGLRLHFKRSF